MEHHFWHQRWQAGQIGWHLPEPNPLLKQYLPELALPQGASILVPLCGKSVDLAWLLGQGYHVIGAELSPLAREQFVEEQGIELLPGDDGWWHSEEGRLRWFEGDFFALTPDSAGAVDAVYDRAALVAFAQARRPDYVRQLASLAPGAQLLLISLDAEGVPLEAGPPFVVPDDEVVQLFGDVATLEKRAEHATLRQGHPWWEKVWLGRFKAVDSAA
ncbi:thiopurine S-methyltransferase [Sulfurivirga caldicuralii]|uniref:Thiopurine S-methyltransferase n=1 Tax=Sulfurivirga caldicuralii TaxID=364032 RepID=A0A1N6G507_9GAMM|nr:hypothetical protein [Sulfurivirga caldicuralii]SIO02600.1 thiopurine S-methyltransferase [Sulfurivirga caldicuralii]